MKNNYHLALFDMDGTLIDSMDRWINMIGDFMTNHKIVIHDELISNIQTLNLEETVRFLIDNYTISKNFEECIDELDEMMMDYYLHQAKLKPGALELLHRMKEKSIPMAIATASISVPLITPRKVPQAISPAIASSAETGVTIKDSYKRSCIIFTKVWSLRS